MNCYAWYGFLSYKFPENAVECHAIDLVYNVVVLVFYSTAKGLMNGVNGSNRISQRKSLRR